MNMKTYEIIATWENRVDWKMAQKLAKEKGLRILTNKEADEILQDKKLREKFKDAFPCWTSTLVDYDGEECTITEGKMRKEIIMPCTNGWYEMDEFGLPFGKASNEENKNARYLWRSNKNNAPLVCGSGNNWSRYGRRGIDAIYGANSAFAVVGVREKPCRHKHKVCADCGAKL